MLKVTAIIAVVNVPGLMLLLLMHYIAVAACMLGKFLADAC
jgi:hypothetical protein